MHKDVETKDVITILQERDGMTRYEAEELWHLCNEEIQDHVDNGDLYLAEQCIQDYFSLEPDYLMEFIA